ncbi:hypothetical protein OHT52_31165 [Streptomyces sp. NBC_00247]|uniref:hypothetical protein n=1 Tax=Streptomyces sp. NBC_00247 TaxID=2975689 RepID=UPI002E2C95C5|nr:hypothetical protein [Streptomyces sp. NBC_00247]
MPTWPERKDIGDRHESRVMQALQARGWTVQPCGQGIYPAPIQDALRRTRSTLRQFPDLIAARGADLVTIDAKERMPSTCSDRYAISTATVNAGLLFTAAHAPTPLYYVLGDMNVLTPAEVLHYTAHALRHRSGAYYLVSSHQAHAFDDVFGPKASRVARAADTRRW